MNGQFRRQSESRYQVCWQRARAKTSFLASPKHDRVQSKSPAPPGNESAHALRTANLVCANADQIDPGMTKRLDDLAEPLSGIDMKEHIGFVQSLGNLADWLNNASLVIDV